MELQIYQRSPGELYCNNIMRNRKTLHSLEVNQAENTLGVDLSPDGKTRQQAEKMLDMATKMGRCNTLWLHVMI